jgi:hypothetical protein
MIVIPQMATGTVILARPKQWSDRLRSYRVLVDGAEVGRLSPIAELRIELPEGEHEVVAKIDWARSNRLSMLIRAGEVTELEVGANARGWLLLFGIYFATVGFWQYLYLRHRLSGFPIVPSGEATAR